MTISSKDLCLIIVNMFESNVQLYISCNEDAIFNYCF